MPNVKATKVLQKRSERALDAFHKYYSGWWGEERWHDSLFPAMSGNTRYCALMNQYVDCSNAKEVLCRDPAEYDQLLQFEANPISKKLPLIFVKISDDGFPPPMSLTGIEHNSRLMSHWNMDAASVLAACMLNVEPGDKILDLCAAPGGKSIVLAQMLWPCLHAEKSPSDGFDRDQAQSVLNSNEFDKTRHARLESNLRSYLPQSLLTDHLVKVLHIDGSDKMAVAQLPFGEGGYDKVLVDAPCSSERHIIHGYLKAKSGGQIADEMSNWKSSHSKTLAKTQVALLMTALRAVKIGGAVLYATCSISQEENDDVVDRALEACKRDKKKAANKSQPAWEIKIDDSVEKDTHLQSTLDAMTEPTKYGRIALPDHKAGGRWGPLYFVVLRKQPSQITRRDD